MKVRSEKAPPYGAERSAAEAAVIAQAMAILEGRMRSGRVVMNEPRDVKDYFRLYFAERQLEHREEFAGMFLDAQHRLIAVECLSVGTVDGASVPPREVLKTALRLGAVAVVFAHNHPSGEPTPSAADRALTSRLRDALALVSVRVLDHIVVGDSTVSFAERGWI